MRALYHFQPRKNWMNDPNGPVFIDGELHMFYQHNPSGPAWGNMTWGHAVSPDLVTWRHLPHALAPTPGGADKDGVFSGCCVMRGGRPHILYTGVHPEVLCLAIGDEKGLRFEKYVGNPILLPEGEGAEGGKPARAGWRDPFVWREGEDYIMAIGSGGTGGHGAALTYRSRDLIHWESLGELHRAAKPEEGDMWECPNFLRFDGWAALLVSALPMGKVLCIEGTYKDGAFAPQIPTYPWDLGDCFYAPNTVQHENGRYIQYGWMRECGDPRAREAQGWQGMLTLPREVRYTKSGLCVRPAREVTQLRGEKLLERRDFTVRAGDNPLKGLRGTRLEVEVEFEPGANTLCLEVLRGQNGDCARISYDGAVGVVDADIGALSGGERRAMGGAVAHQSRAELRAFIDGTALEIYINARETLTTRAYPVAGQDGLRLYAQGGVRVSRLAVYNMRSAYADDNTQGEAEGR